MGEDRGACMGPPKGMYSGKHKGMEDGSERREASGCGWALGRRLPMPFTLYLLLAEAGALPVLHAGRRR